MLSYRISVPNVLMNFLVPKKGVHYGQSICSTELWQTPFLSVNVRVSLSSDNTLPCAVISTHMCIEITIRTIDSADVTFGKATPTSSKKGWYCASMFGA